MTIAAELRYVRAGDHVLTNSGMLEVLRVEHEADSPDDTPTTVKLTFGGGRGYRADLDEVVVVQLYIRPALVSEKHPLRIVTPWRAS